MVADLGYAALAPDLYDREGARLICIELAHGCLLFSIGFHASFDGERVLDQACRLGVLIQKCPGFGSCAFYCGHYVPFCTDNRQAPCFLGFLPKFVPRFPLSPYFLT